MPPATKALLLLGVIIFTLVGGVLAIFFSCIALFLGIGVPFDVLFLSLSAALLFAVLSPFSFWQQLNQKSTIRVPYFDEEHFKRHLILRLKLVYYHPIPSTQSNTMSFLPRYPETWWTSLDRWLIQDTGAERFRITVVLEGDNAVITGPATKREWFRRLKHQLFAP